MQNQVETKELGRFLNRHGKMIMNEISDRFAEFVDSMDEMEMGDSIQASDGNRYRIKIAVRKIEPKKKKVG